MKHLLLILSILLTCTAAQAQRYRLVADTLYDYDNDSSKLYKVMHYAYSGDRGSNATNDTVDYDTCIVYRYDRMVFDDTSYGYRNSHYTTYKNSSKPRLAAKTIRVRNAQGQIDTVYHYKPVLRDTLDLASITVYNRRPDGKLYSKDVYGLVYCQPPDKEVSIGESEEDTLIDGEWHYAIPLIGAYVAQPKVAAGYRITQKDSFEYKDGVLQKNRYYFLFYNEGETGSIEYFEYDDFDILKKCKAVKQYENGNMMLWESYNVSKYCYRIDYSKVEPYYRMTARYFADGSRQSYGVNVVSDIDTLLVDTTNVMRDVYGRDSATFYYRIRRCSSTPLMKHIYYNKKGLPQYYLVYECDSCIEEGAWWLESGFKLEYDRKGRQVRKLRLKCDDLCVEIDELTPAYEDVKTYAKEGYLSATYRYRLTGKKKKQKELTNKHTYTYEQY